MLFSLALVTGCSSGPTQTEKDACSAASVVADAPSDESVAIDFNSVIAVENSSDPALAQAAKNWVADNSRLDTSGTRRAAEQMVEACQKIGA